MQPSNVLQIRQVVDTDEFTTKVKIVEKLIEAFEHKSHSWCLNERSHFIELEFHPIFNLKMLLVPVIGMPILCYGVASNVLIPASKYDDQFFIE